MNRTVEIPAKTFIFGEYAALAHQSAMIWCSKPCFKLEYHEHAQVNFHPLSPAGQLIQRYQLPTDTLKWTDPYNGIGGLGASSAEFVALYRYFFKDNSIDDLIKSYDSVHPPTNKPSGYDVLAQDIGNLVFINRTKNIIEPISWPFEHLVIILAHTGQKLKTHDHLKNWDNYNVTNQLSNFADAGKEALLNSDDMQFINLINETCSYLKNHHLLASHSDTLINQLRQNPAILAVKGCGAMGADVIAMVVPKQQVSSVISYLDKCTIKYLTTLPVA